jgi:hypothetical protein
MPFNYDILLGQLLALLRTGHTITVRWNCGSDEHIVTTQLDGVEQEIEWNQESTDWTFASQDEYEARLWRTTDLSILLGDFVVGLLGLPSVGEFSMQGGGRVLLQNQAVVLEFQSEATSYEDNPAGWLPEEYLSATELAELCPERLQPNPPDLEQFLSLPDSKLAAAYTGRRVMFQLN